MVLVQVRECSERHNDLLVTHNLDPPDTWPLEAFGSSRKSAGGEPAMGPGKVRVTQQAPLPFFASPSKAHSHSHIRNQHKRCLENSHLYRQMCAVFQRPLPRLVLLLLITGDGRQKDLVKIAPEPVRVNVLVDVRLSRCGPGHQRAVLAPGPVPSIPLIRGLVSGSQVQKEA